MACYLNSYFTIYAFSGFSSFFDLADDFASEFIYAKF